MGMYATDGEKQKAYRLRKENKAYKVIEGFVIEQNGSYKAVMDRVNGNSNGHTSNKPVTTVTNSKHSNFEQSDKKDEITKQQPTPQQIIQVTQVIQCLHINANKKQREALTALLGSYDVNTVRHWLLAQYQALL